MRKIVAVAALGLSQFAGVCGNPAPPPPDDCSAPGGEPVASIAIGPERMADRPFEPWADTDTAYITAGAQGGDMLGVALALAGNPPPACLAQRSEVRLDGEVLAAEEVAINTYEAGDGTRITNTLWLVFDGGTPALGSDIEVVTEAGGRTATAQLTVVADRHRLVSLAPTAATVPWGQQVTFELDSVHAPAGSTFQVELSSEGDPGVLQPAATATIYGDQEELWVQSYQRGTAELIVRYGDQELRASVTVE